MRYNKTEAYKKIVSAFNDYDLEFEATEVRTIRFRVFLDSDRLTCVRLPAISYYEWKSPFLLDNAIINARNYLQGEIVNLGGLAWAKASGDRL
ncbi:hypothetical protein [Pantoea sp. At-9b]|uniref:hypothetical protein n=1 Tax=Pantoea sp. (strain At-9b) TaxID=592316 RepID=UPI0001B3EBDD|nr:hypothetical protein [Pantoea sp. At-9b]ADU72350.1 methionine aminopeptidase [Pantoea sp. At-9b]